MTNTLLWTGFYIVIALVVLAVVVRAVKRRTQRKPDRRFHGPR